MGQVRVIETRLGRHFLIETSALFLAVTLWTETRDEKQAPIQVTVDSESMMSWSHDSKLPLQSLLGLLKEENMTGNTMALLITLCTSEWLPA